MATKLTAADLRVGNKLFYHNKYAKEIMETTIDWQDLKWVTEKQEDFNRWHKPIPLTEEMALKLWFKQRKGDDWLVLRIGDYVFYYNHDVNILQIERRALDLYDGVAYFSKENNYLHTLQNLVKDLTNTELTIKDDNQ